MDESPKKTATSGQKGPRRSRDDGLKLVKRWQSSGHSASKFCGLHDVKLHALQYWITVARQNTPSESKTSPEFYMLPQKPGAQAGSAETAKPGPAAVDKALIMMVPLGGDGALLRQTLRALIQEMGV